jgi:O-antigen biosynthesis protein
MFAFPIQIAAVIARLGRTFRHTRPGSRLRDLYLTLKYRLFHKPWQYRLLAASVLFDRAYYLAQSPELRQRGGDPIIHYLHVGTVLGHDPHPLFDTSYYLKANPDVAGHGTNPLVHYLTAGAQQERNPHPLFDNAFYRDRYSDILGNHTPLVHYLTSGAYHGCDPHPCFESSLYCAIHPEAARAANPLIHYLQHAIGLHPRQTGQSVPGARVHYTSRAQMVAAMSSFSYRPTVSILLPTADTGASHLGNAVNSVLAQLYPHWELCLCHDGPASQETRKLLAAYENRDSRIRVQCHGLSRGVCAALTSAQSEAQGEFIAILHDTDELTPNALLEVIESLNENRDLDVIYTDQSLCVGNGAPIQLDYKPHWSPELLREAMYVGQLLVARRELAARVGGFDSEFDSVPDFEWLLRLSEHTRRIHHIPKILYHARRNAANPRPATTAAQKAVNSHLQRCGIPAVASVCPRHKQRLVIEPRLPEPRPRVSLILHSASQSFRVPLDIGRLLSVAEQQRLEILVPKTLSLNQADRVCQSLDARFIREKSGSGTAAHAGACQATSAYLLFMDIALQPLFADWIDRCLFYCLQPDVGCVSPGLVNNQGTLSDAGPYLEPQDLICHAMRRASSGADGDAWVLSCSREVSAVSGHCVMIARSVFDQLGGLNPYMATVRYQLIDLSLRATANSRRNICTPRAVMQLPANSEPQDSDAALDDLLLMDIWKDRFPNTYP